MQVRTDRILLRHHLDQLGDQVIGVRGRETHAPDPVQPADSAQQAREVPPVVPVRVDRLAQQGELRNPLLRQLRDLLEDRQRLTVLLRAACVGNDAEGAAVVAAPLNRDPGRHARVAPQLEPLVVLRGIELDIDDTAAVAGRLLDELGQRAIGIGPDDQVHVLGLTNQPLTQPLGHTAADADECARPLLLHPVELRHPAQHPLFRVLADRTSVHQNDIRFLGRGHLSVAAGCQNPFHELAVAQVHLTAVGFYPVRLRHAGSDRVYAAARRPPSRAASMRAICIRGPVAFKLSAAGIFR